MNNDINRIERENKSLSAIARTSGSAREYVNLFDDVSNASVSLLTRLVLIARTSVSLNFIDFKL
ncbi:MAG: hypothetical protein AAF652_09150 [Cyanobacteria bacterium P01_C01_bin.72]